MQQLNNTIHTVYFQYSSEYEAFTEYNTYSIFAVKYGICSIFTIRYMQYICSISRNMQQLHNTIITAYLQYSREYAAFTQYNSYSIFAVYYGICNN